MLKIGLAGRAAEVLVLGTHSMGAGGAEGSDLAQATGIAAALEMSYGLGASAVWLGPPETAAARVRIDTALRIRVEAHLQRAEAEAMQILDANRELLEEMATALVTHKFLSGGALDALVQRVVWPDPAKDDARREAINANTNVAAVCQGRRGTFSDVTPAEILEVPV
jgi:ATP-dependent Zn protease